MYIYVVCEKKVNQANGCIMWNFIQTVLCPFKKVWNSISIGSDLFKGRGWRISPSYYEHEPWILSQAVKGK